MPILIPVLILGAAALLCAVLLTVASVFFGVKTDETEAAVRDCLPGANCGACGYSGCDGYAAALASGEEVRANLCIPGGDHTAADVAGLLGLAVEDVVERVAYVACNGSCAVPDDKKYLYTGPKTCRAANLAVAGDRFCVYACLGYGDCMAVCPQGAIRITEQGVASVDPRKCTGCGMCERTCPNGIIHLVRDTARVVVKCSNHDKGAAAMKVCKNSCIACGKCERVCPEQAIRVENNLAVIDYERCIGCGLCREACPRHSIQEGNLICGAHLVDPIP